MTVDGKPKSGLLMKRWTVSWVDLISDPDKDNSELLDARWCYSVTPDALIHNILEVLSWIQVWGM